MCPASRRGLAVRMNKSLAVQQFVPEQTIQSYLDALLQDAAAELAVTGQTVASAPPEPVARVVPVVTPTASAQVPAAEASLSALSADWESVPAERSAAIAAEPSAVVEQAGALPASQAWREQPFEALLFEVGGLKLAVPLVSLGTIHALETDITPLFGQPDWFLGILPSASGNLKVLDTARWVMPERYTPDLKDNLKFVISVQGHDWGMAVHGVSQSIRLMPEQVKWRSQQGKRPWLAGTVIEHMCALLDVSSLAALLVRGATAANAPSKPVAKASRRH
jgi:purine-binding chemotaxis protein CheW